MKLINCIFSFILLFPLTATALPQSQEIEQRLDAFAKKIQTDLQIQTGSAVGIVKDGELILQKKYGYLNVEKKTPLAEDTPFYIASATKSFVGLLAVILADKGYFNEFYEGNRYLFIKK
jgi:CubicO group peptidase (beta-lactamase class C family)